MFEALRWRKAHSDAEAALEQLAHSLAQAGRAPIVIGSLAAVAILGMAARMGYANRIRTRGRTKVIPARAREARENAMPAPRNGRRRRKRKTKAAAKTAVH
jgi:hypothetical protein